jgi:hypothetical protein
MKSLNNNNKKRQVLPVANQLVKLILKKTPRPQPRVKALFRTTPTSQNLST